MKSLLFTTLVSLCWFTQGNTQKIATGKENREMFFRISAVNKITNDSISVKIIGGSKQGIANGSTGVVKGVYKTNDDRSDLEIGFASVASADLTSAYVTIRPVDKTGKNKNYEIRIGDYVKLKIQVPKLPYRSILFELALLDIQFNNLNNESIYSIDDLFYRDSKQLEDSILSEGAKDVFKTYDALKNDTSFNNLRQPMKDGRYQGRSIFDVMRDCNARDVFTFLHFVNNYPGKYIGNTWKLNETFATWVMNKAPYSKREIYDSVTMYKNKPVLLKAFLVKNIAIIKDKGFVTDWISDANELADNDKDAEALPYFEAAKIVLPYLQDDCVTAYYHYCYATIFENKKEYTKVLSTCDSAYFYFNKCGNDYFKAQTLLKKGLTYNTLEKNDDALAAFDAMFAEVNKTDTKIKPAQKTSFTAKYHHFSGIIQAVKGELKKAANHYENAISNYKSLGNYSNLQSAISVQGRLARLYKRQGELNKSLVIYNEQLELYTKLNDKKNIADVLYNIGDIQYDLANYRAAMQYFKSSQEINISFNDLDNASLAESMIAQSYYGLGKYDSAIAGHTKAIDYRKQSGSKSGMAFSWKKLGSLYNKSGEKAKSLAAYDSAAHYYTITKDSARLKDLLSDIGDVYYNDKQYQKAFATYFKWHQLNIATKNKSEITNSLYQLAESSNNFNTDTAKQYALSCLQQSKEIGDKNNIYNASTLLGFIAYKKYDYDEGNKYFSEGLNVAIDQKNKKLEATSYKYLGLAHNSKLDFDKAIPYLEKSLKIFDSLGDKTVLPASYRFLANAIQSKGDFYEARKYYKKSIDIAYEVNSRADIGYGYSALTFLYVIQGELPKAEQSADSAYIIFNQLNNSWQMAEAYFNKALVFESKSDGENAIKYYKKADSIYVIEKDIYGRSTCHTNMGAVLFYQSDFKNSLSYFIEADKFLNNIKYVTEAHILAPINIGEANFYLNEYAKAEQYLTKGYNLAIQKKAGRMQNIAASFLGKLFYATKKYDESEKYLIESLAISEKSNETDLYLNTVITLAKLYSDQNKLEKGNVYFNKGYQFIKKIDNSKYTWWALYEYGLFHYKQNKYDSAIKYFKEAIVIVENESQKLFGGAEAKKIYNADTRKVDLYNKLVVSLAKTNNKEDALYYADKSNNQAIKEQAERAGLVTNDKEKAEAIKKGGALLQKKNAVDQAITKEKTKPEKEQNKQLIASLESIKNVTESDYTNYIENLQRKYPDLQSYFANTNPKDFRNYIDYIPDSTIVVLYIINDNQLLIFTVTNKETGLKTIELKQDINKQASRFLSVLRNPNNATGTGAVTLRSTLKPVDDVRGDFKTEANELYNLLITPIAEQMKDKKNICFIPNGKLSNIPFQSLGHLDENKAFHFLMEDYAIFYTSKIDIFKNMFKKRKMEFSLAIFGNPDKTLPGATIEAKEISKIINGSVVYIEEQATEDKAKESLAKYNYIHFATHGVLDYDKIENSYLLFAPGPGENNQGKLTIGEINGLIKQTSSLVVLSACETAVSKEEVKGFYISPTNAFLTNRVDAVIGSLWKVPDETTNLLLQEFYNNIEKRGMSNVQALRNAQATVSANPKYNHPFFWSAFVLYGEWR